MDTSDWGGRCPSECLFDDGRDVGEVINIGVIWQPSATQDAVQLTLGCSHYIRAPGHCKEKTAQYQAGLEGSENHQLADTMITRTVSDIPAGSG